MKMPNFFKRKEGMKDVDKKKYLFTTRDLGRPTANGERMAAPPTVSHYYGDSTNSINNGYFTVSDQVLGQLVSSPGNAVGTPVPTQEAKKDERKFVEPKAVFEEVKRKAPDISFENLDEKIKVVSERINIMKEHVDESHLRDEHMALFFLKNRRTYLKTMKKDPMNWATTTREAIDDLCKRYKLKSVALKQFYTLVPKEGIQEMERFTRAYKAITGDVPIFELIIKDAVEAKKPEEKAEAAKQKKKDRDPILLANSPFGNFLFVLGAWDDEVEVVDEIIYGLK